MADARVTYTLTGVGKFTPAVREFQAALWCCAYEQAHNDDDNESE